MVWVNWARFPQGDGLLAGLSLEHCPEVGVSRDHQLLIWSRRSSWAVGHYLAAFMQAHQADLGLQQLGELANLNGDHVRDEGYSGRREGSILGPDDAAGLLRPWFQNHVETR